MKWVPDAAKSKSCFNSRFMTFGCALRSTTISILSCKGILVKRLQTSYETKNLSLLLICCISLQKLNESLAQCSFGITGSRSSMWNSCLCQFAHGLSGKEMVTRIWQKKGSHV